MPSAAFQLSLSPTGWPCSGFWYKLANQASRPGRFLAL